jgi:hypothetical protein
MCGFRSNVLANSRSDIGAGAVNAPLSRDKTVKTSKNLILNVNEKKWPHNMQRKIAKLSW